MADNLVKNLLNHEDGTPQPQTPATFAVASETAYWMKSFELEKGRGFGLEVGFTGTTINVKVELEQANVAPATENATDANYVVTDVLDAGITDAAFVHISPSVIVSTHARLKLTGLSGNHADVVLSRAKWVRTKV